MRASLVNLNTCIMGSAGTDLSVESVSSIENHWITSIKKNQLMFLPYTHMYNVLHSVGET